MQSVKWITWGVAGALVSAGSCKVDDSKFAFDETSGAGGLEGPRDPCVTFPCKAGEVCISITRGFDCRSTGPEGGSATFAGGGGSSNGGAAGNAATVGGSPASGGTEAGGATTGGTEAGGATTGGTVAGGAT